MCSQLKTSTTNSSQVVALQNTKFRPQSTGETSSVSSFLVPISPSDRKPYPFVVSNYIGKLILKRNSAKRCSHGDKITVSFRSSLFLVQIHVARKKDQKVHKKKGAGCGNRADWEPEAASGRCIWLVSLLNPWGVLDVPSGPAGSVYPYSNAGLRELHVAGR